MRKKIIQIYALSLMLAFALGIFALPAYAQGGDGAAATQSSAAVLEKRKQAFHATGLPLPRFVSLGKEEVYVRAGPGQKYPIEWVYTRKNYPVEVILEFGNWRKVRDIEGEEGWVFHALLSGKRHAIIKGKGHISVYTKAQKSETNKSRRVAKLEPLVVVALEGCRDLWCKVSVKGYRGWVQRKSLWGVYEHEFFD